MTDVNKIDNTENKNDMDRPRQYVPLLDDVTIAMLSRLVPSMKFVQIEGMMVDGNTNHQFLVSPLNKMPDAPSVPKGTGEDVSNECDVNCERPLETPNETSV